MFNVFRLLFISALLWSANSYSHNQEITKQTIEVGNIKLHYEFADGQSEANQAAFTETIVAGFEYYQQLFGGYPRDLHGETYNDITVRIRYGDFLSGEADPKLIMLTWSDAVMFGVHNWRTMLLHELFHLWSAESFRYSDGREHWFNEGFSEFYAFKAATKLGMIDGRDALTIASQPIGFYYSANGLGKISLREAGKNNKSKFNNYFFVYHGGWVAAMLLDHDIRSKTDNNCSLDQSMRFLYQNYPRNEKLYDSDTIVAAIKDCYSLDYSVFFERYIDGTEIMPVSEYFDVGKALWNYEFGSENIQQHRYLYQSLGLN
ncbi:hypothetical protein [Idiomarina ramblicola]|uniref:Peptidase M61 catalytic domain-containing protein n=1 Tax=Idiomarina ramblicola TaxID=263724 RepID=A0A432YYM6_9GAMM|nr:hypothetical protein [Idiomarina ramblicola]RUO68443.1 hypothetical protein CWI78_09510 [Idiomarina ramblicola]